jgi:tripartite-type tricarboxylate transporter receptor subunit TctC
MQASRRKLLVSSLGLFSTLLPSLAQTEDAWPSKPIRIISPGAPGGSSDIFVRIIETHLRERLGQALFIENHPGSGGMTGASVANAARPDGYTFFVSNAATNGIGVSLYRKPTFDWRTGLPAVARIATMTNAIAVRADRGINTLADLVAYIKANPQKAFFGSAGSGTSSHLGALLLGQRIGVELTHVPYKGTASNLTALLGGEVLFAMDNLPLYMPYVKTGTLKLLAVTRAKRSVMAPNVPTMQESGIPDFDIFGWFGLSAATGTPPAIINRMGQEIVATVSEPAVAARITEIGAEPAALLPQAYAAFIQSEVPKWGALVKSSGAAVD